MLSLNSRFLLICLWPYLLELFGSSCNSGAAFSPLTCCASIFSRSCILSRSWKFYSFSLNSSDSKSCKFLANDSFSWIAMSYVCLSFSSISSICYFRVRIASLWVLISSYFDVSCAFRTLFSLSTTSTWLRRLPKRSFSYSAFSTEVKICSILSSICLFFASCLCKCRPAPFWSEGLNWVWNLWYWLGRSPLCCDARSWFLGDWLPTLEVNFLFRGDLF